MVQRLSKALKGYCRQAPNGQPNGLPTRQPSHPSNGQPNGLPSGLPTGLLNDLPNGQPNGQPSGQLSRLPSGLPSGCFPARGKSITFSLRATGGSFSMNPVLLIPIQCMCERALCVLPCSRPMRSLLQGAQRGPRSGNPTKGFRSEQPTAQQVPAKGLLQGAHISKAAIPRRRARKGLAKEET